MFSELMPLLADRTVLITVARASDTVIRATVILSENPSCCFFLQGLVIRWAMFAVKPHIRGRERSSIVSSSL